MPNPRPTLWLTATFAVLLLAPPLAAQAGPRQANDATIIYRREVFDYSRAGRPDPFRPLVGRREVGARLEDLSLRGVVYHPDASRSVAVLARAGTPRPLRARVGDDIGGVRIVAIHPRSIDVLFSEFGVARRETLEIKKAASKGSDS